MLWEPEKRIRWSSCRTASRSDEEGQQALFAATIEPASPLWLDPPRESHVHASLALFYLYLRKCARALLPGARVIRNHDEPTAARSGGFCSGRSRRLPESREAN